MRVSVFWALYDFWVGAFWDRKKRILYVCPIPTVVIKIEALAKGEKENDG